LRKRPEKNKRHDQQPPLSRGKLWLFRLTALLLPLAFLGIVELALRLGGFGYAPHFFKRLNIEGQDCFVQNDDFSLTFFPPETARFPGALRMPVHKAPGTFRIFVFGESAAMGDPEPAYGAARYLEMLLREKYPDKKFEVINVAFTAINSHVIVPIARECAGHDGDLWIVYMGNNEMVGPFGAATVFGNQAPSLPYVRLVTASQRTRIGQGLVRFFRNLRGNNGKPTAWGGMQMFLQNQLAPDSPLKANVYKNFKKNLREIVQAGTRSGAAVLLNTVAVNLKDSPPFASATNRNLSTSERAQFDSLVSDGCRAEAQGDFTGAAGKLEQALQMSSQCADVQFRLGKCLLEQTNFAAAREHLQFACDDDALPFRADSRLNEAIRKEGANEQGGHLRLLDASAALGAQAPAGVCGQETFYEHVHFDFDGSYRLARAWAEEIKSMLPSNTNSWASQERCEEMLGLSDWNRALVLEHMIGRMQQAPLNGQADNAERIERLQARAKQLRVQMNSTNATRTRASFERELAKQPDDYVLRENFALFLQSFGNLKEATEEWRRIRQMMPHDYMTHFQIGHLLREQGAASEAEPSLRTTLAIRPSLTEAWVELGNVLTMQEKLADALDCYSTALKQRPLDAQTLVHRGEVLGKLNRHGEAKESYEAAIKLDSGNWEAHFELAGELDLAGQLDGARNEFGEAARLNPGYSRAHFNYGVLLAKQGRFDEAGKEFEETLRLEPTYSKAREYLAQLQKMQMHGR
jgi:tetratricopeptide (TPR) repeat protein